jgi:hypothetical protein
VIALNIPLMLLAITRGYDVLSLFLVTNLLCCSAVVPVALGLVRSWNSFLSETGVVVGVAAGVLGVSRWFFGGGEVGLKPTALEPAANLRCWVKKGDGIAQTRCAGFVG